MPFERCTACQLSHKSLCTGDNVIWDALFPEKFMKKMSDLHQKFMGSILRWDSTHLPSSVEVIIIAALLLCDSASASPYTHIDVCLPLRPSTHTHTHTDTLINSHTVHRFRLISCQACFIKETRPLSSSTLLSWCGTEYVELDDRMNWLFS